MIHLYPTGGGHIAFKEFQAFSSLEEVVIGDKKTLWISPAFVAFLSNDSTFVMLPWTKVDNVHIIRKSGEDWPIASGG